MCGLVVASDVLYCVSATLARTKVVPFAWRSASSIVPFAPLLRPVMLQFIAFAGESRLASLVSTVLVSYPCALPDMARSSSLTCSIRDAFVFWVLAILCRVSIADVLVHFWHCDAHLGSCLEISPKDSPMTWCFLDDSVPYASQSLRAFRQWLLRVTARVLCLF